MNLSDSLNKKGIIVITYVDKGQTLRRRWEGKFAGWIDPSTKASVYLDEFLWHVFSYEKLPCSTSAEATIAFENEPKRSCYVFYQDRDIVLLLDNCDGLTANDLVGERDVYIVDTEFTWTYVQTHESDCGPYFYKASFRW